MQFNSAKRLLVALLLAQVMAVSASGFALVLGRLDVLNTDPISFLGVPTLFNAEDLGGVVGRRSLKERQIVCLDPNRYVCDPSLVKGCCRIGWTCGIYRGKPGCCPNGQRCECDATQVDCGTFCCPVGSTCSRYPSGANACAITYKTGRCQDYGFTQCPDSYCCPAGIACIPPHNCNVRCAADDPRCADSCCLKGTHCVSDSYCELDPPGYSSLSQGPPKLSTEKVPTPDVTTPEVPTPEVPTSDVTTPDVTTPDVTTPEVPTSDVTTPDVPTSDVSTDTGNGQDTSAAQTTALASSTDNVSISSSNGTTITSTTKTTSVTKKTVTSQTLTTGAAAVATMGAVGMMVGLAGGFLLL